MRKNRIIYTVTALAMAATLGTGCKKFLDVNQNLSNATSSSVSLLLSGAERTIGNNTALGTTLGNVTSFYVHQTTGRVAADRYGGNADAAWSGLLGAVANLDVVIERGKAEGRIAYVGVAKILKAYTYSMLVDAFADVPFSEFNKFGDGILQPKFDKGKDIYPKLIALLDEGIADVSNTTSQPSKPGGDDYIYKGNLTNWVKAANTIKLKMYTQVRLVQDVKAEVTALLASPATLINQQSENFILPYGPNGTTDDRHPAYGEYTATQRGSQLLSPWIYEIMKGVNPDILNGITDPRLPYYYYNQKSATANPENCTEYRDGGFITLYFGASGNACHDGSNSSTYSLLGIYPAGGRYEDGTGRTVTNVGGGAGAGTGALPHTFISYADRLFLEAELQQAGVVTTGSAATTFAAAIDASFNQMEYYITTYVKPGTAGFPQTVPSIASTVPSAVAYKAAVTAQFAAASAAKKMELIMTEKWINRIENPADSYTDYRRTGYPVLFAPAPVGPTTSVTSPDGRIWIVSNEKKYPVSMPFNATELALNKNAPPQKIPESYKVFWMP